MQLHSFCYCCWSSAARHGAYTYRCFVSPVRFHWRKLILHLQVLISWLQFLDQGWDLVSTSLSTGAPSGAHLYTYCACFHGLCEFICVLAVLCLEGLGSLVPYIPLTLSKIPLPQRFLSFKGKDLIVTSHLSLSVLWSLALCIMSGCGSIYLFPYITERSFPDDG